MRTRLVRSNLNILSRFDSWRMIFLKLVCGQANSHWRSILDSLSTTGKPSHLRSGGNHIDISALTVAHCPGVAE